MPKRPPDDQSERLETLGASALEDFFRRPAAKVARELVGMTLARASDGETYRYTITETEAYEGVHDLASHSSKGRTKRTEVMFGPAGRFYIHLRPGADAAIAILTEEGDPSVPDRDEPSWRYGQIRLSRPEPPRLAMGSSALRKGRYRLVEEGQARPR